MHFVNLFVAFQGRIGRLQFWLASIFVVVVDALLDLAFGIPVLGDPATTRLRIIDFIIGLISVYPFAAIAVKRLHDLNQSSRQAWLLGAVLAVGLIGDLFGYFDLSRPETVTNTLITGALGVIMVSYLIYLGFRSGTLADNDYGPPPPLL
jgi:uncharacterized membrane protein YhaH (DUF805 family)